MNAKTTLMTLLAATGLMVSGATLSDPRDPPYFPLATIATPILYASASQDYGVCYVYNVGYYRAPIISLRIAQLANNTLTDLTPTTQNCTPTLAAGAGCYVIADLASGNASQCNVVTTRSSASSLRTSLELRDRFDVVLQHVDGK